MNRRLPHAILFLLIGTLISSQSFATPPPATKSLPQNLVSAPADVAPKIAPVPHKLSLAEARALQSSPDRWVTTMRIVSLIASPAKDSGAVYRPLPSIASNPTIGPWVARLFLASLDPNGVFFSRADVAQLTDGPKNQKLWNAAVEGKSMAPIFASVALYKTRQNVALASAVLWISNKKILYTSSFWDPRSPVRLKPTATNAPLLANGMKLTQTMDGLDRVGLVSSDWRVDPAATLANSVQDDWDTTHSSLIRQRSLAIGSKPAKPLLSDEQIDEKTWSLLKEGLISQRDAVKEWTNEDATELFARTLVQSVDPHADYMAPHSATQFDQMLTHAYTGIGVIWKEGKEPFAKDASPFLVDLSSRTQISVDHVLSGSPAEKSGLLAGDVLLGLGIEKDKMTPASGLRISNLSQLSDGPVGMPVYVRVRAAAASDDKARLLVIPRETVHLNNQVVTARWVDYAPDDAIKAKPSAGIQAFEPRALVIKVPDFYRDAEKPNRPGGSVTDDLRAVLRAADAGPGCTGLDATPRFRVGPSWAATPVGPCGINLVVLDLRDNPGGLLTEAVRTVGLFVKDGPVVRTRAANDATTSFNLSSANAPVWNGPMVVLVNQHTASAAEIVSGALQDHHRAIVVGQPTYGKGSAQEILDLDAIAGVPSGMGILGQIHITGAAFFRPSGLSPQRVGIVPDITLGLPTARWAAVLNGTTGADLNQPSIPPSWVSAADSLSAWRTSLKDPRFLLVRSKPAVSDREEGGFNALPSIRLPAEKLPEKVLAVGSDPWVTHVADLQSRAQQRWDEASWSPWWMVTEETKPSDRVALDPSVRQAQSLAQIQAWSLWQKTSRAVNEHMTVRAIVSAASPNLWTSSRTPRPNVSTPPSDVVLASALGVASDAFGATQYPQPWLNKKEAAVPAWWTPSTKLSTGPRASATKATPKL